MLAPAKCLFARISCCLDPALENEPRFLYVMSHKASLIRYGGELDPGRPLVTIAPYHYPNVFAEDALRGY